MTATVVLLDVEGGAEHLTDTPISVRHGCPRPVLVIRSDGTRTVHRCNLTGRHPRSECWPELDRSERTVTTRCGLTSALAVRPQALDDRPQCPDCTGQGHREDVLL